MVSIDFTEADYLIGIGKKDFVADLMPKLPIYVNLLSKEAQAVIGNVHDKTIPALKLLEKEGFVFRDYVDIFDAGPGVECDLQNIASIRNSFRACVEIGEHTSTDAYLMSNTVLEDFRAVAPKALYKKETQSVVITKDVANALVVSEGDYVRMLAV